MRQSTPSWQRRHQRTGIYYVLPALVLFAVMIVYPIARSFYLSFFDYSILEPDAARFVGLGNYVKLVTSPQNRGPFWNTLYFTAIFVPPYVLTGLGVALLLNRVRRGSVALRTMIFTPVVVSLAVSAVMWTLFYNSSFGLAACGILTFLGIWNEFLFALTFTSLDKVRTLPVGIYLLRSQFGLFNSGVLFATVLLSFLPIVLVFVLLQKYFVRGLSAGALKG